MLLWMFLIYAWFLRTDSVLLRLFPALIAPYTFSLEHCPPLELLQVLLGIGLLHGFGLLIVKGLNLSIHWTSRHALAFLLGFGLSGIAFELLTMAWLLYPIPTWLLWIALYTGAFLFQRKWSGSFGQLVRPQDEDLLSIEDLPAPYEGARWARYCWYPAFALVVLITFTTFWHGMLFPETYWDSLILYLGYGRMTFLEHGFPFKAEAQVGIGLGANYPHLFSSYGAIASMLFGEWSSLHQRTIAPLAAAMGAILVYATAKRAWGSALVAIAVTLLFRAMPNGIAYSTYASDYAFAILFCAGFAFASQEWIRRPTRGILVAFTLIPAIAMHLNYLMGILWVPWAFAVGIVFWRGNFTLHQLPRKFFTPLANRFVMVLFFVALALASPWYIRNTVLTGNPVYAFFPEIFTKSVRMNTEVLRSAELEWFRHGDGIGRFAELYRDYRTGKLRDEGDPAYRREATVSDRISASFLFWVGFDVVRLHEDNTAHPVWIIPRIAHLLKFWQPHSNPDAVANGSLITIRNRHAYKTAPLFAGYYFPALFFAIAAAPFALYRRERKPLLFLFPTVMLTVLLLAYVYFLADFYLYQIIGIVAPAAITAGFLLNFLLRRGPWLFIPAYILIVMQGIVPGLAFGLMNFKVTSDRVIDGQLFSPFSLVAFRNPGIPQELFYRMRFGDDVLMWNYVNENLDGETILSHENRHYVFNPSITFVHLDDWAMQAGYDLPTNDETLSFLNKEKLRYYLKTENERNHPINRRLGMDRLIEAGLLKEIYRAGGHVLYEIPQTKAPAEVE